MKNKLFLLFIQACLLIGLAWILTTCKDKETPDPCAGAERVSAEFVIGQRITYRELGLIPPIDIDTLVASDTVLTGMVYFEATEQGEGVTYEWQIGNEQNTSTQRQFLLVFQDPVYNVPVRLIVRKPNSACFAQGSDADTLVKYLTVIERDDNPIYGTYEGYLLSKPDETFEVKIANDIDGEFSGIININQGCNPSLADSGITGNYLITYKNIFFIIKTFSQFGCLYPIGWGRLDKDNSNNIYISYQRRGFPSWDAPMIEEVFVGIRKID